MSVADLFSDPGIVPEPDEWNNVVYFLMKVICDGGEFDVIFAQVKL